MSLSRLAVRRPVAVAMFFLAVVLLGIISFTRLPVDLLPDVSYPRLVVYTSYPEVAPAEIERQITEPIERQVASVPGVESVTSSSRDGVSLVTLRFGWGTDMDFAMLNTRERLDNARAELPEVASRPQILRVDPDSEPILVVSVAGDDLWELRELAENVFRRRLEQLDGVAQASVTGGLEREIRVEVDPERMEAFGLSIAQVSEALAAANHQAAGGTILEGRARYPLRTLGEFRSVDEISEVVVGRRPAEEGGGGVVLLRDVGRVTDGFADRESLARYGGREAVGLLVFKESAANTVQVARVVDEVLELLRAEFPEVTLDVAHSQAGFIADSIDNVVSALVLGGMLAFLVLFLFLREPRYPVAVALAIPISVVGTFVLMELAGVSLNIMSLGGLALGVGMLVDNSIIVLENIFRHREGGGGEPVGQGGGVEAPAHAMAQDGTPVPGRSTDPLDAAAEGAGEVAGAITASTLTTIAVFLPIVYVEGVAGELFRDLSLAVAFSLLASLLVALTLLPTLAARFRMEGEAERALVLDSPLPGPRPAGLLASIWWGVQVIARLPLWLLGVGWTVVRALFGFWWGGTRSVGRAVFARPLAAFDRGFDRFAGRYHRALEWSLDRRGFVLGLAAVVLAGTLAVALTMDRDLLPRVDQGAFEVRVELPEGTALSRTDEVTRRVESLLLEDEEVAAVFAHVGRDARQLASSEDPSGLHTAELQVRLREGAATDPVLARLRGPLRDAAAEGSVTLQTGQATALGQLLGGGEADIAVRVRGQDLERAMDYADELVGRLAGAQRLTNLRVGTERGHPQFGVEILRDEAARFGLSARDVAEAVEHGMRGMVATEFITFDRKVPVVVRLSDELRYDRRTLERLQLAGVPLREVLRVDESLGPAEIRREDQGRVVTVLADVAGGGLDRAIREVEEAVAAGAAPSGLQVEVGGENEEMRRSFRDLALAFALALILVYMILAAQFESFLHPFTILAAVPLALVGAVLALLLAGEGLNTMSLIGIVILVGIVVNDSIVKVDFIVRARDRGEALRDAVIEAGRIRLRPIVMTTVTTVLGLTPMALGIGRGADLRAPLAIAVIGGLLVATLLTLIVVPVLFSVVEELRGAATLRAGVGAGRTSLAVPRGVAGGGSAGGGGMVEGGRDAHGGKTAEGGRAPGGSGETSPSPAAREDFP
jgi:hydrophobic/amphiphilic exporter-1 (mainly G- bacteria), HAE1 family